MFIWNVCYEYCIRSLSVQGEIFGLKLKNRKRYKTASYVRRECDNVEDNFRSVVQEFTDILILTTSISITENFAKEQERNNNEKPQSSCFLLKFT